MDCLADSKWFAVFVNVLIEGLEGLVALEIVV